MKLKPCFEIIDLGRGWFKTEIVLGNAIWISKVNTSHKHKIRISKTTKTSPNYHRRVMLQTMI